MRTQQFKLLSMASLVALMAVTGTAYAAHPDYSDHSCGMELNGVGDAIDNASFSGGNATTNQSNLLTKLANAAIKIEQQKYLDAADKLQEIADTATALANARKRKLDDATAINEAVTGAILCVGALP